MNNRPIDRQEQAIRRKRAELTRLVASKNQWIDVLSKCYESRSKTKANVEQAACLIVLSLLRKVKRYTLDLAEMVAVLREMKKCRRARARLVSDVGDINNQSEEVTS
jgi:hypothetical protein